ncbi:MAG TPA: phosphotransferase [Pseudonocardiaceae bacterium]|jgi:Ser/Thr protein kinase RdoA (MazF antagonist)|nr:phosphotransferase [Pseudonocardiaceae bacterium]
MSEIPKQLAARWRLRDVAHVGAPMSRTWQAARGPGKVIVKQLGAQALPDWPYQVEFMGSMHRAGWPVPELLEAPEVRPDGIWLLLSWLPGAPADSPGEALARGRLLAQFHADAAATGMTRRRTGFPELADVVADGELDSWLAVHELSNPKEGALLRTYRRAAHERFEQYLARYEAAAAPRCVIHGDFARWNLLFDNGRLSAVLDFEGCHDNLQVADFALAWRGHYDGVLRGYDSVRPLSDLEWRLVLPVYWAWLFLGVKDALARSYGSAEGAHTVDFSWPTRQLRRRSALLMTRFDEKYPV